MAPLRVALCSSNPGKLAEVRDAFPDWQVEPLEATDYPEENGETYLDNARIKADFGRVVGGPDRWLLADDSGIEIAALDGEPGVQTARWAEGRHVEKTLAALAGVDDRRARYVAELVLVSPDRREVRGTGILEGEIARSAQGQGGFGFDPVFVPLGESRTVAQLGEAWKAVNSHRGRAAQALCAALG